MKLTNNRDSHIIASQIAACFNTFVQVLTFDSSPAAVSIWNHHHKHSNNAINERIQRTRFTVTFITSIILSPLF
jgi:hypothetical protein